MIELTFIVRVRHSNAQLMPSIVRSEIEAALRSDATHEGSLLPTQNIDKSEGIYVEFNREEVASPGE